MLLIQTHARNSEDGWARIPGRLMGIRLHCTRESAAARLSQLRQQGYIEREFPEKLHAGGCRLTAVGHAGLQALASAAPAGGAR
jgi:hypothetical protein